MHAHLFKLSIVHCICICFLVKSVKTVGQIVYAVNCGGDAHIDSYGIHYEKDPLHNKVGIASDYGKRLLISRVQPNDQVLYQTERYHTSTFGYDIPVNGDGEYVLVLKFCEVYFNAPNQKVFDVVLNGEHSVVTDLDIFHMAGRGVAHDEYVEYTVYKGKLIFRNFESEINGNKIRVEFIKGYKDNPKINAMFVIKGNIGIVPKLLPLEPEPVDEVKEEPEVQTRIKRPVMPKVDDRSDRSDDTISVLPVFIAVGIFIPALFCMCKL